MGEGVSDYIVVTGLPLPQGTSFAADAPRQTFLTLHLSGSEAPGTVVRADGGRAGGRTECLADK
jgi:hypothetical protein